MELEVAAPCSQLLTIGPCSETQGLPHCLLGPILGRNGLKLKRILSHKGQILDLIYTLSQSNTLLNFSVLPQLSLLFRCSD
jgi:hypothetical protein